MLVSTAPQRTATRYNALQRATHCSALQRTATHCNALRRSAPHSSALQHTAAHCNTLQHTATHYQHAAAHIHVMVQHKQLSVADTTLNHTAPHCTTLRHTAPHCTTLHHTARHYTTHNTQT